MADRHDPVDRTLVARCRLRADAGDPDPETGKTSKRRTLTGLAVPFNETTRIDNWWEGRFDEMFVKGSLKRTLGMRIPKLMFEHGRHYLIGTMPLGQFGRLEELDEGLDVDAELFDNWLMEPLVQGLESEAIDGMSIRFRPLSVKVVEAEARTDVDDADVPLHIIEEAELFELGPVMFPAYPQTSVGVRSFADLGDVDLSNPSERLRLAMALLVGDANAGWAGTSGPGTPPREVGGPATRSGPASSHPDTRPRQATREADALARWLDVYEVEQV